MSLSRNLSSSGLSYSSGGYEWYQCDCCPYGYHIDLDFVQYCESVGQNVERTASMKRRKDRRRQRQSMDVLLGLIPPLLDGLEQNHKPIQEYEPLAAQKPNIKRCFLIEDTMLNDAVNDFERTLQHSKNTLSNNLPDVTAVFDNRSPSVSSASLTSASSVTISRAGIDDAAARDFDAISLESNSLSPLALHAIREQMAVSLERMKQLEEQVKVIPSLHSQIIVLKAEKTQLQQQLEKEESAKLTNMVMDTNSTSNHNLFLKSRSLSFTNIDSIPKKKDVHPVRRDFGVSCTILTRNIGVGHQYPNTRSVSTETLSEYKGLDIKKAILVARSSQTFMLKDSKKVQTADFAPAPKSIADGHTQTFESKNSIAVTAMPDTSAAIVQVSPDTRTVAVSEDKISDLLCLNCRINKKDIPSTKKDFGTNTEIEIEMSPSLSLASLPNLNPVEEKVSNRSIGCQHVYNSVDKSIQHKTKSLAKASQHEIKLAHKTIQYDIAANSNKNTDTADLGPIKINIGCDPDVILTNEISTNTTDVVEICPNCLNKPKAQTTDAGINTAESEICSKCSNKEKSKNDEHNMQMSSRIPRLQAPTTPIETRKFLRQDTYTKVPAPAKPKQDPVEFKHEKKVVEIPTPVEEDISETLRSENEMDQQRRKAVPSKEMQAAMKVLNDSLQKRQRKNLETQVKNALSIIQQEWFKISSTITAKPLDVEDYLDYFEEISSALLEYIVNMVDASGNTAMHYAVSHGNFDVVSILLDSKVCDINKQNKAGYTCVMLVCLAEVRSTTHSTVVRRLFSLADVNIRAKQHAQTALMLAVSHGRLDMVKLLLEAGADVNIQDEDGSTSLMCAAEHGHVDIVKHFLSHPDCDSSICDVDGSTALKIAMEAGHRHIGVLLYAHERNLHGSAKHKRSKSASASPRTPSSPLPIRSITRPTPSNK